jgi:hypothetical protein
LVADDERLEAIDLADHRHVVFRVLGHEDSSGSHAHLGHAAPGREDACSCDLRLRSPCALPDTTIFPRNMILWYRYIDASQTAA